MSTIFIIQRIIFLFWPWIKIFANSSRNIKTLRHFVLLFSGDLKIWGLQGVWKRVEISFILSFIWLSSDRKISNETSPQFSWSFQFMSSNCHQIPCSNFVYKTNDQNYYLIESSHIDYCCFQQKFPLSHKRIPLNNGYAITIIIILPSTFHSVWWFWWFGTKIIPANKWHSLYLFPH